MIEDAIKLDKYLSHFKYILIDEYQDISNQRFVLIKKYTKAENSHLMCVGDDWQTIFSFAASDITKILDFQNSFIDTKILKILMTYRNSQELVNVAGTFVMRNSKQIKKKLHSIKSLKRPIEFIYYSNPKEKIARIILKLNLLFSANPNIKIAFLLRYTFDIKELLDGKHFILKEGKLFYKSNQIFYYTVHTSKGLGFDYVFLLNNKKGYYGFPANRKQRSLFKEEKNCYEERRLFYVALTRTKNKVYLVTPVKHASLFTKEIKKILKKNKYLI